MFTRLALSLVLTVLWLSPSNLHAQSEALMDAYKQGQTLYAEGRFEEAVPLFRTAFVLGVEEFGPNHPTTATLANNLAALYKAQGRYEAVSRTRFPWTQNWLNRSVQGGPEHDRQF